MQQIRAEWTKYDILSRYFGTAGLLVSPVLTCYNISPMSSVMNDTLARYLSIRGVSFKSNTASIVPGNERADEHARAAAGGGSPEDAVKDGYRRETSLSHMTRVATEARARPTAQWIAERTGDPRRGHRPPPGRGLGRKLLQRVPKCVAGRYGIFLFRDPSPCQSPKQTTRCATSRPKLTANDDEPTSTRVTATVCASSPKQQRRGPWAGGQTSHDETTPAEPWPDRSTSSPRREQKEGGIDLIPQKAAPRPTNAEQEWSSYCLLQHTLPTHNEGGTMYVRMQRNFQSPFDWPRRRSMRQTWMPFPRYRARGTPWILTRR